MNFRAACAVLASLPLLFLTGCGTTSGPQLVKVAVPVPCQARVPDRPTMPTEALGPADRRSLDKFVQAAEAEIERREGYEGELLAALNGCIAPLPTETPGGVPPPAAPALRTSAEL